MRGYRTADEVVRRRVVTTGLVAVALVPFVVAGVAIVGWHRRGYYPMSDIALVELHVRAVGSHAPLVGPWSRLGWSQPGPLLFFLLAPAYRLLRQLSVGVDVGALAVNAASVAGIALVARRRGGLPLALVSLAGIALLAAGFGERRLHSAWAPDVALLPFALLALLCWALACGDLWMAPLVAGIASFVVQTHVSYVPVTFLVVVWAVLSCWAGVRRDRERFGTTSAWDDERTVLVRVALVTGAVVVVAWALPIYEQVTNSPGNLELLIRYLTGGAHPDHSLGEGYHVLASQLSIPPDWVSGHGAVNVYGRSALGGGAPVPTAGIAAAVLTGLAWHRAPDASRLGLTALLGLGAGIVTVSRVQGPADEHVLQFARALGWLTFVAVAWIAWCLVREAPVGRDRPVRAVLSGALLVTLGAGIVVATADATRTDTLHDWQLSAVSDVVPKLIGALPQVGGVVVVVSQRQPDVTPAIVLALRHSLVSVEVDEREHGPFRQAAERTGATARAVVTVTDLRGAEKLANEGNAQQVAAVGTAEARRVADYQARVDAARDDHGRRLTAAARAALRRKAPHMPRLVFAVFVEALAGTPPARPPVPRFPGGTGNTRPPG